MHRKYNVIQCNNPATFHYIKVWHSSQISIQPVASVIFLQRKKKYEEIKKNWTLMHFLLVILPYLKYL